MTVRRFHLPLNLKTEEVYPFLGMPAETLTSELQKQLKQAIQKVSRLAVPQGVYTDFPVRKITAENLKLAGTDFQIQGKQTMLHFATAAKVTLLAVTVGSQVAAALEELSCKKIGEAVFFDAAASAAAESLVEQLDALICREIIRKGFYPTARFSPGYGDWGLHWQKSLVSAVQGDAIGISVTPYFLLEPVKSITAVIGWSTVPVTRSYELPKKVKPCQGNISCQHCPLSASCASAQDKK